MREDMLRLRMLWIMLLLLCGQSIKGQRAAFPGGARSPCLLTLFLWAIKGSVYAPTTGEQPAVLPSPQLSLKGCKLILSLHLIAQGSLHLFHRDPSLYLSLSLCITPSTLFKHPVFSFPCVFSLLSYSPLCFSTGFPPSNLSVAFVAPIGPPQGNAEGVAWLGNAVSPATSQDTSLGPTQRGI